MKGARIAFTTLGCKVNRVESDTIAAHLLDHGVVIAPADEADVVVINTCTVTGEADRKARKAVRRALALPRSPVVVATGCLAALDADSLSALGERVVVVADKDAVAETVAAHLSARDGGVTRSTGTGAAVAGAAGTAVPLAPPASARAGAGFRTRVAVKVEDGCDAFCTYCIVPHARGAPRSVALDEVAATVRELSDAGVPEVVLTGINLGRYRDPSTGADLSDVVAAAGAVGVPRIRLSSVEPGDLSPRLLATLAATPGVCAHLHVPLQSGCDRVLSAMGRPYTVALYAERIAAAREAVPGLAVTTDVIAGFPGETDEEAERTRAAIVEIGFARLHVFRYSRRHGTPAAEMSGQVASHVIARRAGALRSLDAAARTAHAEAQVGTTVEVLVESVEEGIATGTTREYVTCVTPAGTLTRGAIARARVTGTDGASVRGELVPAGPGLNRGDRIE